MSDKAIEALTEDQEQLDEEGIMVGVSREALHEVIKEIESLREKNLALALVIETMRKAIETCECFVHDSHITSCNSDSNKILSPTSPNPKQIIEEFRKECEAKIWNEAADIVHRSERGDNLIVIFESKATAQKEGG